MAERTTPYIEKIDQFPVTVSSVAIVDQPTTPEKRPIKPDTSPYAAELQKGGNEAWAKYYSASRSELFRYANRILHNPDTAEDVVQTAFGNVYKFVNNGADLGGNRIRRYMFRAVHNEAVSAIRSSTRAPIPAGDDLPERHVESALDEGVIGEELTERVLGAIQADGMREVFRLHMTGVEVSTIAETLDIPENTVRTRLFRARKAVKNAAVEIFGSAVVQSHLESLRPNQALGRGRNQTEESAFVEDQEPAQNVNLEFDDEPQLGESVAESIGDSEQRYEEARDAQTVYSTKQHTK